MTAGVAHLHGVEVRDTVRRVRGIVLFLDIEDSVRLIERDEAGTIYRWLDLVEQIEADDLVKHSGRLLKNLGDGLLVRFHKANDAVKAAFAIRKRVQEDNQSYPEDRRLTLRFGITSGRIIDTGADIFGHEVNLCARLMSIARGNDIFVTNEVRVDLDPCFDDMIEDLGEVYIRNLIDPVHAFRISSQPLPKRDAAPTDPASLQPIIAVLPFTQNNLSALNTDISGLSDELTEVLAHSAVVDVVSMLSVKSIAGRNLSSVEIGKVLGVDYLVSGNVLHQSDDTTDLYLELGQANSHKVLWRSTIKFPNAHSPDERFAALTDIAEKMVGAISKGEVRKVRSAFLETLSQRTLLTAAVTLSYRLTKEDFLLGGQILESLVNRSPNEAHFHAHLADWHLMRVQQGWSESTARDASLARQSAQKAIDLDPDNSVALMVDGEVLTYFNRDFKLAEQRFNRSLEINPNNAEALLMRGALFAFTDRGAAAVEDVTRASRLAPLHPNKYLYNSIAASAHLTARNYERAILLAENSWQANSLHTSTLRVLIVAHWKLGHENTACDYVRRLLDLDPSFRIGAYLKRAPSADYEIGKTIAACLRSAGVPD